jgi:hypothetical protein
MILFLCTLTLNSILTFFEEVDQLKCFHYPYSKDQSMELSGYQKKDQMKSMILLMFVVRILVVIRLFESDQKIRTNKIQSHVYIHIYNHLSQCEVHVENPLENWIHFRPQFDLIYRYFVRHLLSD